MGKLPSFKSREVIKALEKLGYREHRQKGSHLIMVRDDDPWRQLVIPIHAKDLKRGTLRAIIKQAGITVDEFLELL